MEIFSMALVVTGFRSDMMGLDSSLHQQFDAELSCFGFLLAQNFGFNDIGQPNKANG